ncbi:hypothetical protein [Bradyrhizobium australafricanum]|uniref:hypothetical protein n=1 Tax=Bradyrhizobium australafricanum TaxID=2821406 RepID=UPI001CE284F3|nr:hypothetical protein [Bradyrhizobium australafricanum]MCA6103939.1 hypothetical protein [Bradyrhizobium australafricanum]
MVSRVEACFDEILALVASGMTIREALKSRPEFPPKPTFKWFVYDSGDPERRIRLEVAKAAGKAATAGRYKPRAFSEQKYERSLEVVYNSDPAVRLEDLDFEDGPTYYALRYRAVRDASFASRLTIAMKDRKWGGRARTYTDAQIDRAIGIIRTEGHARYRESHTQRGLPHYCQILRRAEGDPALLRRYQNAVSAWVDTSGELHRTSLLANNIYRTIDEALPRHIERVDREDVISDIVEEVISGRVLIGNVPSLAGEFVRRHDRMFSRHRNRSLDEPVFKGTRVDSVSADVPETWGY